jgi:glycosyltransferase involved in cell wall biosynthesis
MPAHNAAPFVTDAVRSVLDQSYPHLEVIVVDDGSTDGGLAGLATLADARVTFIRRDRAGVSAARNVALAKARGDVVAFLDADDLWDPGKLEAQLQILREEPGVGAVGGFLRYISTDGKTRGISGTPLTPEAIRLVATGQLMPFQLSSLVVRRDVLAAVGPFDENLDQAEDLDLLARIASLTDIRVISEPLGAYRLYDTSSSARDYYRQRDTARFVARRAQLRALGGDLSWEDFIVDAPAEHSRRADAAAFAYRRTGQAWLAGCRLTAGGLALRALMLAPRYTLRRVGMQLAHLRRTI